MKWGIAILVLVVAGIALGWKQTRSPFGSSSANRYQPEFVLETKFVMLPGEDGGNPRTTYTYFQKFGSEKRELWRITQGEKYRKHWIGPNGNVWVLTDPVPFTRAGTRLWIRDTNADLVANIFPPPYAFSVRAPERSEPLVKPSSNIDVATLEKVSFYASRLKLKLGSGIEFRVNEFQDNDNEYRYIVTTGTNYLVDQMLARDEKPSVHRPLLENRNWEIWTEMRPYAPGVLAIFKGNPNTALGNVSYVESERKLVISPAHVETTPGGRILWFTFGFNGEPKEASMTVFDWSGKSHGKIDFLKEGGYESPYEAEHALLFKEIKLQRGNQWIPLSAAERGSSDQPEIIEIRDTRKHAFRISIPGYNKPDELVSMVREAVDGDKATKETRYPDYRQSGEKSYLSKNGLFSFRIKLLANEKGERLWVKTLIFHPKSGPAHEFWSKSTPFEVRSVFVSDSGRTYSLEVGKGPDSTAIAGQPIALLSICPYNGDNPINVDLAGKTMFDSFAAASKLDIAHWDMKYSGPVTQEDFEGEAVDQWTGESVVLELPNGTKRELNIVDASMPMAFDRIYWRLLK